MKLLMGKKNAQATYSKVAGREIDMVHYSNYPSGVIGTTLENLKAAAAGKKTKNGRSSISKFADIANE